ncbi:MAG: hypothetical protein Q9173_005706 [Seirophora scorigena]
MPDDAAAAKFLYAIMEQIDLKKIDWQIVADRLDIATANAARMRYYRLKAQMESTTTTTTTTAKPKATTPRKRKDNPEKATEPKPKHQRLDESSSNKRHVVETDEDNAKPFIKAEPVDSTLDKLPASTTQNASDSQRQKTFRAMREHEQTIFGEDLA